MDYRVYPDYRLSGADWLDKIPSHWDMQKLKHVAEIVFSNVDKHVKEGELPVYLCNYVDVYYNDYITEATTFMQATASQSEINKFALRQGDVIITKDSESWDDIAVPAYVASPSLEAICGYHLAMIRPSHEILNGHYLFRAFSANGIKEQFKVAANGITRYGLGKFWIDNALFPIPPLDEQMAIIQFLEEQTAVIDQLITEKQTLIQLLHEKRNALISHAVTKGLNPNAPLKDSGIPAIGTIPTHWQVRRNKQIFFERNERSQTGNEELLTVSHITGITPRSQKDVNMFLAESLEGYKLCYPNDLVINTMWAWMGALGITQYHGIVSPSYHVYCLTQPYIPDYLDLLYRTPAYICEITQYSKGIWSSRLRLYPDAFFDIFTITPPLDEQRQIVAHTKKATQSITNLIQELEVSIQKLQEYRTALISAAVTGKIDVRGLV